MWAILRAESGRSPEQIQALADNVAAALSTEFVDSSEVMERLVAGEAEPDLILWDRVAPESLPTGVNHLFFGAVPPGVWANETRSASTPVDPNTNSRTASLNSGDPGIGR